MVSIIVINTWRGLPFYGITLLAGLQTVPSELYDAAAIDGAGGWHRFRFITLPLLRPIILIVTLFSVIFTFADFQLVYVLTGGGPANATQLFATYAYQIGVGTGLLSEGAAVSLAMFPFLLFVVIVQLLYIRRVEVH
jgi:multiple sugar transport system permease protein